MRTSLVHLGCMAILLTLSACQPQPRAIPAPSPNLADLPADSPAYFCPADAKLYIQVNRLSHWRAARHDDPLMAQFWKSIEDLRPSPLWASAAKHLGISPDQFTDLCLGECFAVISRSGAAHAPFVLVARVKPEILHALPAAMDLKPAALTSSPAGFQLYLNETSQFCAAIDPGDKTRDGWLLMTAKKNQAQLNELLEFAAARLAENPVSAASAPGVDHRALPENADFQSLLAKLPAAHDLLLYTADGPRSRHVACLALASQRMTAQYVGRIDKMDQLYQQFSRSSGVDFGILPATAITAVTFNLMKKDDKGMSLLNLFIVPRSIEQDVLPKLDAPILLFLGQVDGANLKPNPGIRVPAVGAAVRMKDPAVATDLDRIVNGLHFFSSVGELDIIGGFLGGKTVRRNGLTYQVTDFGQALLKAIKDRDTRRMFELPDAAALTKLTYGKVGPWYLVCSQEALFLECAESFAREEKRLSHSQVFKSFPFEPREGLMLSAMTRAPELAALMKEVSSYWEKMEAKASSRGKPQKSEPPRETPGQRIRQPMEWIGDAIKRRDSFYIQIWRDKDGDLAGRLSVVEPQPK